jgi:hypothetical protein
MVYFKFYYALLDLKKVMIFAWFIVTIYIELELLVYLVNYIFLIRFFCFLNKLMYILLVYNRKLSFFFPIQLDSLLLVCTT